ncbi:MAG: diguanylate cyclase [Desulfovibrio sp.]|jgi:diguanylate cyclase (GGDEF)-like protein
MHQQGRPETMWGLGLNESEAARIQEAVGHSFELRNHPQGRALPEAIAPGEQPGTVWIPLRAWQALPEKYRDTLREMENSQRILIQGPDQETMELEQVLEQGFLTTLHAPLSRDKVQDALFRAKEVTSLYSDIYSMTEEIILERELLKRKTDQLLFLNRFLTNATGSLDPSEILSQALEDLGLLLPVKLLQAAFWLRNPDSGKTDVELLLDGSLGRKVEERWVEFLLETTMRHEGGPIAGFQVERMRSKGQALPPDAGRSLILPLAGPQGQFGCLALLCDRDIRLAKDQVQTLKSAVRHLGLALNNARLYREVKIRADRDGLTKLHNRQTLDSRLALELKRSRRYGSQLSLLMLDLDHFKQINDTYGHAAGDMVLQEVGHLLQDSIRSCDVASRFGGEEFVLLLPHTSESDAWKLAERIRERIDKRRFRYEGQTIGVTVSIGVSSLTPGTLDQENDLLVRADQALYVAKANGRNSVATSDHCDPARTVNS